MLTVSCASNPGSNIIILPTATMTVPTATLAKPTPIEVEIPLVIPEDGNDLKNVTVVFWYAWSGETTLEVEQMAKEFNRTNEWGIEVIPQAKGADDYLESEILEVIQDNQAPELVAAPIDFLAALHSDKKQLVDLNAYVLHKSWGLTEREILTYPLSFWQQDVSADFRFGMPSQRNVHLLFYNQTWARELGFYQAPATPDEFMNQACAAARANAFDDDPDNNGTGGWLYNYEPITVLSWLKAFKGGDLPKQEGENYFLETKNNEDAFNFLYKIFRIGCAWVGRDMTPHNYFTQRRALFYSGSLMDLTIQENIANQDDWTLIAYPGVDESPVVLTDGYSYGIFKSTPEKQLAAWLFIQWMQKPGHQARLIRLTNTYPLTNTALDELVDFHRTHPTWESALQVLPMAQPAPTLGSWAVAGNVLQDAAWQLTQLPVTPSDIPSILAQADKLITEVLHE